MALLNDWMSKHDETDETLASKVAVSRVQISRLRRGIHRPSVATARQLEAVTGIPAAKFLLEERA